MKWKNWLFPFFEISSISIPNSVFLTQFVNALRFNFSFLNSSKFPNSNSSKTSFPSLVKNSFIFPNSDMPLSSFQQVHLFFSSTVCGKNSSNISSKLSKTKQSASMYLKVESGTDDKFFLSFFHFFAVLTFLWEMAFANEVTFNCKLSLKKFLLCFSRYTIFSYSCNWKILNFVMPTSTHDFTWLWNGFGIGSTVFNSTPRTFNFPICSKVFLLKQPSGCNTFLND